MNKKIIFAVIAILLIAGAVWFGLSRDQYTQPSAQPTSSKPIKIGVVVYPGFGTLYIAQEKGFFKEEGINIELVQLAVEAMLPALESNQVNMLVGSANDMPIYANAGIDAQQILAMSISYGADGIVVDQSINQMSDLKGKKVLVGLGFPGHFLVRSVARDAGLGPNDIELVDTNPEQVGSAFVAGEILAGATWEPWLSKAGERPGGKILVTTREKPGIITDILMARRDLIENRREDVKRVMRAFLKASEYWKKNRDEGNAIVAKKFSLSPAEFAPMRDTVQLLDYQKNLEKFDQSKPLNVYELTNTAAEFYLHDGVIQKKTDARQLTDPSLLKELY